MKWYLAKLVFRIVCGEGNHPPQFDEQLRLINADDELHAFHKARLLGEGDHLTEEAGVVAVAKWEFIDVTELHPLAKPSDGAEIYSVIRTEPGLDLYIRNVKRTGNHLLQQSLNQFTSKLTSSFGV